MAKVLVNDSSLTNIADAIRTKKGNTDKYLPSEMADAILSIKSDVSKEEQTKSLDITANGDYDILPDSGKVLSKAKVNVNVPIPTVKEEQSKRVDITKNGVFAVHPDKGKVLSSATVFVNVPVPDGYIVPNGTKEITENGTHDVAEYSSVNVNVESSSEEEAYNRVGYLQFNADMRFDTGIICDQNTKIKVVYTRDEHDSSMYLYGVTSDGNTASVTAYLSTNGTWRFGSKGASLNITSDNDLVRTAIVSKTGVVRANATTTFSSVSAFETVGSLIIGGTRNSSGSVAAAQFVGKIYEFKMWSGDELVLDFIPCMDSDGNYYFYNDVTKEIVRPLEYGGAI